MASTIPSPIHLASGAPPTSPVKRRRFRWRFWFMTLLTLLVVSEILLRLVFGFAHPVLYQADTACGYVPKPNQKVERFFCVNYCNQYSMRSPEIQMPRPAHTFRVLCIGDSVTYGTTFVTQNQIFTSRLAASLPTVLHEAVEVLNASAGGWAPGNEFAFLENRGTFDANLVLFVWNTPDLDQEFSTFAPGESFPVENPTTAWGEVLSRYVAPRLFRKPPPAGDPGSNLNAPHNDERFAANLELLLKARALTEKSGASLGVVYFGCPPSFDQTPDFEKRRLRLVRFTTDHHIPLLDLTAAFHTAGTAALTFDGLHLRPQGHEVVAAEIEKNWNTFGEASASH